MKQRKRKSSGPTAETIAAIAGVSVQLVYRKLRMGKSAREIISEAVLQAEKAALKNAVVNVTELSGSDNARPLSHGTNGHAASVPFSEAQRRKELALAGLREAELAEKTRELMLVEEARKWLTHVFLPLVQSFRALPAELRDLLGPGIEELLRRKVEGIIRSADSYLASCFQRGGKPMSDGALDCGDGWRVEWKIIPPPVPLPEDDAA
jgi:hypothetical protein